MRVESNSAGSPESIATRASWPLGAVALAAGLAGGMLTAYGQIAVDERWEAVANSASPWVMFAFVAGLFVPGRWPIAAIAGVLAQTGLVIGYYLAFELDGLPAEMSAVMVWLGVGVVAGTVYGTAGALIRDGRLLVRVCAAGITGSVWIMEALNFLELINSRTSNSSTGTEVAWIYLIVGVLLPLGIARTTRDRLYSLLALAVATGLAVAAARAIGAALGYD